MLKTSPERPSVLRPDVPAEITEASLPCGEARYVLLREIVRRRRTLRISYLHRDSLSLDVSTAHLLSEVADAFISDQARRVRFLSLPIDEALTIANLVTSH